MPLKHGSDGVTFSPDKRLKPYTGALGSPQSLSGELRFAKAATNLKNALAAEEGAGTAPPAPPPESPTLTLSNLALPQVLRHMTRTPPRVGISTEAVSLLFRDTAGQIGHLAGPQGPIEMVGIAQQGGKPLGELAQQTLSGHHRTLANDFNVLGAHQQTLSPSGRITYVLLAVPASAPQAGLSFVPLDLSSTPQGPAFVAENKRRGLRNMAVSALEAKIPSASIQLNDTDIQVHVAHTPKTAARPLLPHEKAAAAQAEAAARAPAAQESNLVERLARIVRGRGGPQSNPA